MDAMAVGQGNGLEVYNLQETLPLSQAEAQVGQEGMGLLQNAVEAGEVGQTGEVCFEGELGGQEAFSNVLALQEDEDGQGQEFG